MRNVWSCVLAIAMASGVSACATEAPAEDQVEQDVRLGWNWVTETVHERTCDDPGSCSDGVLFTCGQQLQVDYVDFSTGMARLPVPGGDYWVLASALSGSPPPCI